MESRLNDACTILTPGQVREQHIDLFHAHYGYFAIFALLMLGIFGPLIPDETILVLSGIAVHRGQLLPGITIAAGVAGSLCGITVSYVLGRTGTIYALKRSYAAAPLGGPASAAGGAMALSDMANGRCSSDTSIAGSAPLYRLAAGMSKRPGAYVHAVRVSRGRGVGGLLCRDRILSGCGVGDAGAEV